PASSRSSRRRACESSIRWSRDDVWSACSNAAASTTTTSVRWWMRCWDMPTMDRSIECRRPCDFLLKRPRCRDGHREVGFLLNDQADEKKLALLLSPSLCSSCLCGQQFFQPPQQAQSF